MTSSASRRRNVPVVPALATLAAVAAGALTIVGPMRAEVLAGVLLLMVALLWRDRMVRCDLVRRVEEEAAQRNLAVAASEQWFRALVRHSYDLTTVLNVDGTIRFVSPSVRGIFGYDPTTLTGRQLSTLLGDEDVARVHALLQQVMRQPGATLTFDAPLWHHDGRWVATETAMTNLLDDPHVRGIVLNTRDVSDRKQLQDQLVHQAYHDPLTGLANRALFRQRVEQELATGDGGPETVAVLFLDLDGFKAINDVQGHAVGDDLLRHVAARLLRCVRGDSCVARLGGDEFAVLLRGTDISAGAAEVARRITAALSDPVQVGTERVTVRSSTGIAVAIPGDDAEQLLRNADIAMYRAKAAREGGWVRYHRSMVDPNQERAELRQDLRSGLRGGEFAVVYQPIRDLRSGRLVGAEALLRWHHPRRGVVPPEQFLPLAEETGMIVDIGSWVLEEACRAAAGWQGARSPDEAFIVTVNVSARQLGGSIVDAVSGALASSGLDPCSLVLEMTEAALMTGSGNVVQVLNRLKELGVSIAVDDFGTAYSSLASLSGYPVDMLKIDRSFTEQVTRRTPGMELTRNIVKLGHNLGLRTVAEGVENAAQLAAFREMGCDLAQGYLIARPLALAGLQDLLAGGALPPVPARASGVSIVAV